jgi:Fe-S-cluster containining protein
MRSSAASDVYKRQQLTYLAMVGPDGWCIHYDTGSQRCTIYEERPDFCRVSGLGRLFDVPDDQFDAFAITCCQQQIRSTYGGRSGVMRRFKRAQTAGGSVDE